MAVLERGPHLFSDRVAKQNSGCSELDLGISDLSARGTAHFLISIALFTLTLGSLVDQVGYQPFFILLGLLDLAGAILLWTLVRKPA